MSIDALSHAFKKAVDEEISLLEQDLGRGSAETYDAYKQIVGKIDGLQLARELFQDKLRKHADIEEEDEDE